MNNFPVIFVSILTQILYLAMIGRVVSSWLNIGPSNPLYPIVTILYQITEPVLAPIRKVLPKFGMLDFSPLVALILIGLVRRIFISLLG